MENSSGAIPSSNAKLKSGLSLFRCFRKSVRFTTALPLKKEDTPAHQKGEEAFIQKKPCEANSHSAPTEVLGRLMAQQTGYQWTSHIQIRWREGSWSVYQQTNRYMVWYHPRFCGELLEARSFFHVSTWRQAFLWSMSWIECQVGFHWSWISEWDFHVMYRNAFSQETQLKKSQTEHCEVTYNTFFEDETLEGFCSKL